MATAAVPSAAFAVADSIVTVPKSGEKHHGIPTAVFFEDVPAVVGENQAPALIDKLSALSQKYRFFEEKLVKSKDSLQEKIAEVERALKAVKTLQEKSSRCGDNADHVQTHFELSDGIYVRAAIPPTETVCLWLGANVMVEYSHQEAVDLLTNNLASAQKSLSETHADISYLRDQLNTTDVNLSRVYNHHVQSVRNAAARGKVERGVTNGTPSNT